ncbi:MAG TPA: class I SAM-dependent methyltransferase [Blastocatellia bacterium]|nr:class I SAM-dependent methyltransferase [Blastocatellia bacterium]
MSTFSCRSCGGPDLTTFLSLGRTPLANALLKPEQLGNPERTFPLDLALCNDCSLVQITETVPPEELFSEYFYLSSFSDTTLKDAEELVNRIRTGCSLNGDSLAVEIASNDGYLLQYYKRNGIDVLGIEPASNIAAIAEQKGIRTLNEFFTDDLALRLSERQRADVIHANNVMAHVPDLNGFVTGVGALLRDDGFAVVEVPYIKDLIDKTEFDTIYHEHLCYFSLTAIKNLVERQNLQVQGVERIPIHGGSLRVFIARNDRTLSKIGVSPESAQTLLDEEKRIGIDQLSFYQDFSRKVGSLRDRLKSLLSKLKKEGHKIAAYGASAKGSTLLNYCGIGSDWIDFVVDRSTIKQGCFTPGARLPIYSPEKLLEAKPDYVLLLTWNFADEILRQQHQYRDAGGRFIVPVPDPVIV